MTKQELHDRVEREFEEWYASMSSVAEGDTLAERPAELKAWLRIAWMRGAQCTGNILKDIINE